VNNTNTRKAKITSKHKFDLMDHLKAETDNTFMINVKGNSMIEANIHDGDTLLVERVSEPANNAIVVATINNHILVKKFFRTNAGVFMLSQNPSYLPIKVKKSDKLEIWGVVRSVIKSA
jgi:DNA polymerase V